MLAAWLVPLLISTATLAQEAPDTGSDEPAVEEEQPAVPKEDETPAPVEDSAPSVGVAVGGGIPEGPPPMVESVELVGPRRTARDHVVFVRADSQLYLDDTLLREVDIQGAVANILREDPEARVIIESDAEAPAGRVRELVQTVRAAGCDRVALDFSDVDVGTDRDRLFMDGAQALDMEKVEEVEEGLSRRELRKLRPKRWKFPQNPYGSVDFTAYTLEWGEARLGLFNVYYGILPRTQLGTVPLADVLGVYNANVKVNPFRQGRLDLAMLGAFYYVPVNDMVRSVDAALDLGLVDESGQQELFTSDIKIFSIGAMTSLQIAKPWSLHLGATYSQVGATGSLDMANLPDVLIPGEGGDHYLVSRLAGEVVNLRVATDLRFNRRDSIVLQAQAPVYARARGAVSGEIEGMEFLNQLEVLVTYGDFIPLSQGYRASLSYQLQWKHWEARAGVGISPITGSWLMQAFDLSYRFGGKTRREERQIRKGYKQNVKALKKGEEQAD